MTNKTALQVLIGNIESMEKHLPSEMTREEILSTMKTVATELLEKEKTEMAKSFLAGMNRVLRDKPHCPNFEDYYNETFHN